MAPSTPREWEAFSARVIDALRGTVPEPLPCVDEALLAVGTLPGARRDPGRA